MKILKFFFLTAATFALSACTNEDLVNENSGSSNREPVAMSFEVHAKNQTRATSNLSAVYDNFGVWAVKTTTSETSVVSFPKKS